MLVSEIGVALHYLCIAAFAGSLIYAATSDIRSLEIPNRVSIIIAAAFLPAALITGLPISTIGLHYGIGIGVFAVGAFLFSRGLVGGGDVKLLAAVCIWWSIGDLGKYLITVALLGGLLALVTIVARKTPVLNRALPWLTDDSVSEQSIPYGVAIAIAGFVLFDKIPVLPTGLLNLFDG